MTATARLARRLARRLSVQITGAFVALAWAVAPAQAADDGARAAPQVADYSVFVDPATGLVMVRLPQQGWRFAGQVQGVDAAQLPPTVVTSLLPPLPAGAARSSTVADRR